MTRSILLIVSGGIAAYKSLELVRLLAKSDIAVTCVLTDSGARFVTPLSLQALSGHPVHTDLWSLTQESEMGHIELSRSADLVVVAPASADILARMAAGLASDLATTLLLATDTPVLVAPAMNVRMWTHPATVANMATLAARGILVVGPDTGPMACHEFGPGRLAEPPAILAAILARLADTAPPPADAVPPDAPDPDASRPDPARTDPTPAAGAPPDAAPPDANAPPRPPLSGRHALVTAGPTHEAIDPVRYLANRSSGRQGYAIAAALASLGARVTLVSGPTALPDPPATTVVRVESAVEMLAACEAALPADIAVCAAAVGDWRAATPAPHKLKKSPDAPPPTLSLAANPDILATLSRPGPLRPRLVVGFAAETQDLAANAAAKRARKACDWIVANDVGAGTTTMGGETNAILLVTPDDTQAWPPLPKTEVARRLALRIADALE